MSTPSQPALVTEPHPLAVNVESPQRLVEGRTADDIPHLAVIVEAVHVPRTVHPMGVAGPGSGVDRQSTVEGLLLEETPLPALALLPPRDKAAASATRRTASNRTTTAV